MTSRSEASLLYFGIVLFFLISLAPSLKAQPAGTNILPHAALASRSFGNDAPWFIRNIPFFDCSDPQITEIYYYRWKLYKSHLRDLGKRGYIVTEFLDDVSWSLKPYESLNDATAFHIREGRWLKDRHCVNDYINFMYNGGNDRHFSEAIASAAYDNYLVSGDRTFAIRNLGAMKALYHQWDDHYDSARGLYYVEPLLDATEYTISSIDASGGRDGFTGGNAFRPTINSFMYANALAISKLSALAGDQRAALEFAAKAAALRQRTQSDLWNSDFQHFVDRYQVSNEFVHSWDFIRGRELAGYTPWYFELPDQSPKYISAWQHLLVPDQLAGPHSLRTVEPSYQYYMKQYRYNQEDGISKPECQWNGPSWPFQTTLVLGGLANLLNDYPRQNIIRVDDYMRLLRQYTQQHYQNGQPDLQEDYDPDTGHNIVGLQRSHHYNHSSYNDLIITGLAGLRPRADEVLEVNPLIPRRSEAIGSISYFCLENVLYHGCLVTILYDRDGKHYHRGAGLSVYVNGQSVMKSTALGHKTLALPKHMVPPTLHSPTLANLAVNLASRGFPAPTASANNDPKGLYQAIDGRVWFYPNLHNFWTNLGSHSTKDWFSLDLGRAQSVRSARLYFYSDGTKFRVPTAATIQYWTGGDWVAVPGAKYFPVSPVSNGETSVSFSPVQTSRLRAIFTNPQAASVALVEFKAYGTETVTPKPLSDTTRVAGMPLEPAGLHQKNSRTGEFNGVLWRDADNGGFFAFDLERVPKAARTLVVTYWGGDTGNRRFDILVNGIKVAEQTLDSNQPGQFFDVSYPIPTSIIRSKTKLTIRFQASPGAVAGGVFGVRLE